jgi:hypothetical protein
MKEGKVSWVAERFRQWNFGLKQWNFGINPWDLIISCGIRE